MPSDENLETEAEDLPSNATPTKQRAQDLGVPYLDGIPKNLEKETVQMISEEVSRRYGIVTFYKDLNSQALHTAMVDPQDLQALNILRFLAQKEKLGIEVYLAPQNVIEDLQESYGSAEKAVESAVSSLESEDDATGKKKKSKGVEKENIQDAPVAKLVQVIIRHALDDGASDIHIEPIDNTYRVRFRVDGILKASLTFPIEVGRAVVSRIKILATLKIDERRKPQDGRFRIMLKGNAIDFRVSTLPVVEGEKVVMRVLEKDRQSFDLEKLGLMGSQKETFLTHVHDPFGMILMTGPTGSGKSTTLYAFLSLLNGEDSNIITLEDPVEYFIPGINQSQVKSDIGYNFASGLRSILRQDPDVIMVGEIRDGETAELAIHAALTGHLVFSTVHTNNAIGALPRLHDMGIEPFLIGSSVRIIAAQRLLRRICEHCKEEQKIPSNIVENVKKMMENITPEEIAKYGIDLSNGLKFYHGKGCEECGDLGLKGRVAIYEVIYVDEDIQEVITAQDGDVMALEQVVRGKNILELKQDGILKVLLGLTTMSELERITEGQLLIGGDVSEVDEEDFVPKKS